MTIKNKIKEMLGKKTEIEVNMNKVTFKNNTYKKTRNIIKNKYK